MELKVLDFGYVKLIESWGSDSRIIESARMSTNKGFQGWDRECPECRGSLTGAVDNGMIVACSTCEGRGKLEGDTKLLRYLWEHDHLSPFEMAGMTLEMQLPIFVARELIRHRTFSFNELSARYTELPDMFYIPSIERIMAGKQSKTNRQGSEEGFSETQARSLQDNIEYMSSTSRFMYKEFLEAGLSRELARLVIPVSQYTRWRMSGNLRSWLQMLSLRLGAGVQWETFEYAKAAAEIVAGLFPRTYTLFQEDRLSGTK